MRSVDSPRSFGANRATCNISRRMLMNFREPERHFGSGRQHFVRSQKLSELFFGRPARD